MLKAFEDLSSLSPSKRLPYNGRQGVVGDLLKHHSQAIENYPLKN